MVCKKKNIWTPIKVIGPIIHTKYIVGRLGNVSRLEAVVCSTKCAEKAKKSIQEATYKADKKN